MTNPDPDVSLSSGEMLALIALVIGLVLGVGSAFFAPEFYEFTLSAEDGPLEWITAFALFVAGVICVMRVIRHRAKGARFVAITALGALVLIFGAGEEISWGQRIFGWASGEFWQENNAQAETNLHNLMAGDVKINRLLFGVILTLAFVIFFLVLPWLTSRFSRIASFVDGWFIPVPRRRHALLFLVSLLAMTALQSSRAPELGEYAIGLLLAMVVMNPKNRDILT